MKDTEVKPAFHAAKTQELIYELRVLQAMSENVITVTPENTMEDVRLLLKEHRLSGVPVTQGGEIVGIISVEDLIRSLLEGNSKETVRQRMTGKLIALYSDEPLICAVQKFERYGYGRFPVIDRKTGALVGMLTKGDIIRCILRRLEVDFEEQESRRFQAHDWFRDMQSDGITLELRFRVVGTDFEKAGEASSKLKQNLRKLGLSPDVIRRIAIASYEAEMNMVIFASGGELVATIEPGKVTVTAADHGPGIPNVELAMQPGYSTAPDWVRELGFGAGMGLPNIKNCSNELKVESTVGVGTQLRFTVFT